jgi:hypothetical protein
MNWMIEISGDPYDLETLAQLFNTNEPTIKKENDRYVLTSQSFEQYDDSNSNSNIVYTKAQEIIDLLNGISRLGVGLTGALKIKSVFIKRDDGKRVIFCCAKSSLTIRCSVSDGSKEKSHPDNPIREWLLLAPKNENVKKVLFILAQTPLDWSKLYNILEIIVFDAGENLIISEGWASKKSITLFRHTANSSTGLDLSKRHVVPKNQPPEKPMTIQEAKELIISIVCRWLRYKLDKT